MTSQEVLIKTNSCRIKGLKKISSIGDEYFSFQRIHYAKNPVGKLRFKAPVPVDSCPTDVIDARYEGPVPYFVETHFDILPKSENCLHLNVYSKNVHDPFQINPIQLLPVIVFIYGYHSGSSMTSLYGPDYLMQKDIVLVTFNYRLGPLGFLNFDDPKVDVPGNAGLKDQLLVLKWVQDNIDKFGGDPNKVTLVGDSGGAGLVGLHLASEASRGLFHQAILMSGTPFCSWGVMPPNQLSIDLAKATGWDGSGGDEGAYEHLLTVDAETLTQTDRTLLKPEHLEKGIFAAFIPMIETYESESVFLSEDPVKAFLRGTWSKDIDIIIGFTSNEGMMDAKINAFELFKSSERPSLFIPLNARQNKSEEILQQDVKNIRKLYNDFRDVTKDNRQSFFDYLTDSRFVHGTHRNILGRLKHTQALGKTYSYQFSYDFPTRNHHKIAFGATDYPGASHADDISYIFLNDWAPAPEKGTDEWIAVQKMVDLYAGFAIKGREMMQEIGWIEVQKDDLPYEYKSMNIDKEWTMQRLPILNRMRAWDALYQQDDLY